MESLLALISLKFNTDYHFSKDGFTEKDYFKLGRKWLIYGVKILKQAG